MIVINPIEEAKSMISEVEALGAVASLTQEWTLSCASTPFTFCFPSFTFTYL